MCKCYYIVRRADLFLFLKEVESSLNVLEFVHSHLTLLTTLRRRREKEEKRGEERKVDGGK